MTDKQQLLALAETVARAKKPSVLLDRPIYLALGGKEPRDETVPYCPRYTQSIDAALTILPQDWAWAIDASFPAAGVEAKAFPPRIGYRDTVCAKAATPALALTAAALRSRAAMETDNG